MSIEKTVPGFRMLGADHGRVITFYYPNPDGEMERRRARPRQITWGRAQAKSGPQWLLEAEDVERHDVRLFRLKDMQEVASV